MYFPPNGFIWYFISTTKEIKIQSQHCIFPAVDFVSTTFLYQTKQKKQRHCIDFATFQQSQLILSIKWKWFRDPYLFYMLDILVRNVDQRRQNVSKCHCIPFLDRLKICEMAQSSKNVHRTKRRHIFFPAGATEGWYEILSKTNLDKGLL